MASLAPECTFFLLSGKSLKVCKQPCSNSFTTIYFEAKGSKLAQLRKAKKFKCKYLCFIEILGSTTLVFCVPSFYHFTSEVTYNFTGKTVLKYAFMRNCVVLILEDDQTSKC